jgi:hypothetical protein
MGFMMWYIFCNFYDNLRVVKRIFFEEGMVATVKENHRKSIKLSIDAHINIDNYI